MTSTDAGTETQFAALVSALHAVPGESGYYLALVHHTSVLFRESTSEIPGYLFKLRLKTLHPPADTTWHHSLDSSYAAARVSARVGDSYIRMRIRDATVLTTEEIVRLLENCIAAHARYFPNSAGYCYDCWRSGEGMLVEAEGDVATVCPPCMAKRQRKNRSQTQMRQPRRGAQQRQPGWKLALVGLAARWRGR